MTTSTNANHLLDVHVDTGYVGLRLSCLPNCDQIALWEKTCECECKSCADTGDGGDHHACTEPNHGYSFEGRASCETELEENDCWTRHIDAPLDDCLHGDFPPRETQTFPMPVDVQYQGDGMIEICYAPDAA